MGSDGMFRGKVAIVTGGARGMGRTTARRFAEEGAAVCVADIDLAGAEATVRAIRDAGGEAFATRVDVALEADNDRMVAETAARYGGVDIAHLNAALLGQVGGFFDTDVDNFDRLVAVNLRGCYLGLRAVGRVIRPEGAVVAMSSTAGQQGWGGNAPYSATKHAIIGLVRSAAEAFAQRHARVNAVCPGTVNTRMSKADPTVSPPEEPLVAPAALTVPPFRGLAPTQHVAELVLYLASSRAAFITGAVHTIDGGLTAAFPA